MIDIDGCLALYKVGEGVEEFSYKPDIHNNQTFQKKTLERYQNYAILCHFKTESSTDVDPALVSCRNQSF